MIMIRKDLTKFEGQIKVLLSELLGLKSPGKGKKKTASRKKLRWKATRSPLRIVVTRTKPLLGASRVPEHLTITCYYNFTSTPSNKIP